MTVHARISRPYYKETYTPYRPRLLELALKGLEAERATINNEIVQIKSQLNPRPATAQTTTAGNSMPAKKRRMSAAARNKISEAMKRRYAEINKAASQVGKVESVGLRQSSGARQNGGSRLTAAGRKKLFDLMKRRWAVKRKEKSR